MRLSWILGSHADGYVMYSLVDCDAVQFGVDSTFHRYHIAFKQRNKLSSVCFVNRLFFDLEDGGDMFLRNARMST
jgi:hypothetical protein